MAQLLAHIRFWGLSTKQHEPVGMSQLWWPMLAMTSLSRQQLGAGEANQKLKVIFTLFTSPEVVWRCSCGDTTKCILTSDRELTTDQSNSTTDIQLENQWVYWGKGVSQKAYLPLWGCRHTKPETLELGYSASPFFNTPRRLFNLEERGALWIWSVSDPDLEVGRHTFNLGHNFWWRPI